MSHIHGEEQPVPILPASPRPARSSLTVIEVKPPKKKERAGIGKTDEIDATAAAISVLSQDVTRLMTPRAEGVRAALSVLVAARKRIDTHRTQNLNALNALVRQIELGIDPARHYAISRFVKSAVGVSTRPIPFSNTMLVPKPFA